MIRAAAPADYEVFTRLFADFGIPDPVPTRERFVESLAPQIRVAERDGAMVGFCSWRAYGPLAHVVQLAVDPVRRGQRIGEQLLLHVRELALAAGCTRWYLNVKRDNLSAIKLYERVGFRHELESAVVKIAWSCVPPHPVNGGRVEPAEDAMVAERFAVPLERLATFRTRARLHLVALREGAELTGFAAFDPEFPGAMVFRILRPALAADLLEAMRPWALPDQDFVHVTLEGDRPATEVLRALGAELMFEILRLSAPL
jgi:GNAT superfamily N-acetyltransferase